MDPQAITTKAKVLGPFLTLILLSRPAIFDRELQRRTGNQVSHKDNGASSIMPGAVIRNAEDAVQARPDQPAMVNLSPTLALLAILRNRRRRRNGFCRHELTLPTGCVLAARYRSR